jgi:hypothetical protein
MEPVKFLLHISVALVRYATSQPKYFKALPCSVTSHECVSYNIIPIHGTQI